jgi:hypothetical protein
MHVEIAFGQYLASRVPVKPEKILKIRSFQNLNAEISDRV